MSNGFKSLWNKSYLLTGLVVLGACSSRPPDLPGQRTPDAFRTNDVGWQAGVNELSEKAKNSPNEHGRFYFLSVDAQGRQREHWSRLSEGTEMGLYPDFQEAGRILAEIAKSKPVQFSGCFIHTHPRRIYEHFRTLDAKTLKDRKLSGLEKLTKNGVLLAPPSAADISIELDYAQEFTDLGVSPKVKKALVVVDSLGLWYFDFFQNESQKAQALQKLGSSKKEILKIKSERRDLNEYRVPLMIEASEKMIPADRVSALPAFRKLMLYYLAEDIQVRFVPAQQIPLEAPCAGF